MKNSITKVGVGIGAVCAMILVRAGTALAASDVAVDPSGGAFSAGVNSVKSNVTGTYALPLFLLTAAVVGIGVGLAWLAKSKSVSSK